MSDRITPWACALLTAIALGASWMLDGPSDIDAAQAVAADVQDAQNTAQHSAQAAAADTQVAAK